MFTVGTSCYVSFCASLENLNVMGNDFLFIQWRLSSNSSRCRLSERKVATRSDSSLPSRVLNRTTCKDQSGPDAPNLLWKQNKNKKPHHRRSKVCGNCGSVTSCPSLVYRWTNHHSSTWSFMKPFLQQIYLQSSTAHQLSPRGTQCEHQCRTMGGKELADVGMKASG